MDFIFVSMPYAKFDSKWFANVPNINLGIMNALLEEKGKRAKTFNFHLTFDAFLDGYDSTVRENLMTLSRQMGVEFLGLDYVFASLLFAEKYKISKGLFEERLEALQMTIDDFEELRAVANAFVESAFSKLSPFLDGTKLVGFSCSHYQLSGSLLMCSKIKEAYPETLTVVGGKDCAGAFGYELLSNTELLDFVGFGECEVTVTSLLEHLEDKAKPFFNVLYKNDAAKIERAESKENVSVDSLPFPKYDLEGVPLDLSEIILPVEFGRGCPWGKCTFCPDESYNILCQSKSSTQLKEEMEHYRSFSKDLKNYIILDSDSLKDSKLVFELSEYLEGKELLFHFAEFRAERMNRKVLESLLRFGEWVTPFQVGIETFSERTLQLMKKGVSALKNVEVLKMAVELEIPLQFNLFTCYPNMTPDDMDENLRVIDFIAHLLVCENIKAYPGEFYLPTDCPVYLDIEQYALKKDVKSVFAHVFREFEMPSYSNYPYPYQFDNDEEQYQMATMLREKVDEIQGRSAHHNYMYYNITSNNLEVDHCREGRRTIHTLSEVKKDVYMSALEASQQVDEVAQKLSIGPEELRDILDEFEEKRLALYSSDRKSFLSLATRR